MIYPVNEWHKFDGDIVFPWYTHPSLDWIVNNIPKNVTVLELGGGDSSAWWKRNSSNLVSVDCHEETAKAINGVYVEPDKVDKWVKEHNEEYDVVIVDGGGDRNEYVLSSFDKCKKYFIVDNWQQEDVCWYHDYIVDELKNNSKSMLVFKQENHPHWKTAIFIK